MDQNGNFPKKDNADIESRKQFNSEEIDLDRKDMEWGILSGSERDRTGFVKL